MTHNIYRHFCTGLIIRFRIYNRIYIVFRFPALGLLWLVYEPVTRPLRGLWLVEIYKPGSGNNATWTQHALSCSIPCPLRWVKKLLKSYKYWRIKQLNVAEY